MFASQIFKRSLDRLHSNVANVLQGAAMCTAATATLCSFALSEPATEANSIDKVGDRSRGVLGDVEVKRARQFDANRTALWTFHMDPEPLKRLKAVIESGIDVNVSEMSGCNALVTAVAHMSTEETKVQRGAMNMLLGAGADDSRTSYQFGLTALHLACLEAFGACTEVLVAHAEKTLAPASFQTLMEKGPPPKHLLPPPTCPSTGVHQQAGDTPLHMAASASCATCVVRLLMAGADPLKHNKQGRKPIDNARAQYIRSILEAAEEEKEEARERERED